VLRVALVAVVATGLVYGIPWVFFAYPFPGVAVITAVLTSMCALAISVLFGLRHQRTRRRTDLFVATLFGVVFLIEAALPLLSQIDPDITNFAFWTRITSRTLVALGLCATAWLPERADRRRTFNVIIAAAVALAAVALIWTTVAITALPQSVDDATNSGDALFTDPRALGMRLLGMALLLAAALGFARKARILSDPVLDWLAAGAVLMATARGHDFIFPSLHNDWLTTGDMLRLFAEWVILFGLLREVHTLWRRRGDDARAQERRALAAELHDGLAQELAYVTMQTALAELEPSDGQHIARAHAAAERALSETRLRIEEYRQTDTVPLDRVIARAARDIETRFGCDIVLDLREIRVRERTAHELGRVTCEALTNAARHGDAKNIVVELNARGGRLLLTISDDGGGIVDLTRAEQDRTSFGLTSMRERAERLGGYCSIASVQPGGTSISIEVPQR
jgi:signal transduction histidine kinase